VDESKLPEWRAMLGVIKAYDMDIITTLEPLTPPTLNIKKVEQEYIMGGKRPAGYREAVEPFFRDYMEKIIAMFPDIDGYVLHAGVEGARTQGSNAKAIRTFLSGQNLDACVDNMETYLKVADQVALKHNKTVAFWPHQYGINSDGITAMRNMLFKYPRYTIIEEDFWPNGLWIHGDKLPILAFLDEETRAEIDKHNKLGILALSDAEYYGGGALPNAIAEPYIYSMNEVVKRNTGLVVFRINLHDRTPLGSLWDTAGIQIEQSANLLWQNPATPEQVWDRWIKRTYGAAAAPLISKALSNSYKIIYDGIAGHLGQNSRIDITGWMPVNGKITKFSRPAKSSARPPKKGAVIESADQNRAQLGRRSRSVSFAEFAKTNKNAAGQVRQSLALIEQARPMLAKPDYAYLREIFDVTRIMLDIFYDMNQAAYAANLMKDNYDNHPDPKTYFENSLRALEQRAASQDVQWLSNDRRDLYGSRIGRGGTYNNVAGELQKLAAAYRKLAAGEKVETPEPGKKKK